MSVLFAAISALGTGAGGSILAGGAGAAGGAAAAGGSGLLTLSKALTGASALSMLGSGIAANQTAQTEAAFARTQAEQELARGATEAEELSREYEQLRSEQQVIQLANGLDIGVGTPVNIGEATKRQADRNLDMTRKNARNRSSVARLRSRSLLSEGRASLMGGFGSAAEIGVEGARLLG